MGMAVVQCPAGSILNTLRGVKIRLANFQVDHMNPLTFHFMGLLQDVHYDERGHFFGSMGYHFCSLNNFIERVFYNALSTVFQKLWDKVSDNTGIHHRFHRKPV
jgi:hypothetical protein